VAGDHFARELVGRGAAFGDFDRDGDVDVVVVNHGSTPVLLRNDGGNRGAWIQVRLQGTESNRSAIGARVRIVAGEAVQTRVVGAQPSYLSHNSLVQHFGLGDGSQVDTVEVLWAGGRREIWTDIPGQQAIRLVEGDPEWREEWKPVSRETSQRFWEHYRAAGRHRIHGDLEESAVEYELALALDPVHEDALYYLGSVQLTMGRFAESERTLDQLITLSPDSGGPLDLQRAGWALESAWKINREQTGTPLWLGLVALLQDDLPGARKLFKYVLGSNPRSVPATYLLGYIDWTQGQTEAANEALAAAIEFAIPPGNSDAGLLEGDTRNSRPLFAAAMSCYWLEDQLAGLAHRDRDSRLTVEAQYAALKNALEQVKHRIQN